MTHLVCYAHIDDPFLANVMYQIISMSIGEFMIFHLDFTDNLFCHLLKIAVTFSIFGQHGALPGNNSIQDWHFGCTHGSSWNKRK